MLSLSAGSQRNSPAEKAVITGWIFGHGDESVKDNGQFNSSLSRLNLIFSRQPNFLATTLGRRISMSFMTLLLMI